MNIETLTKSQIVLLTLLVSFVTSIATGITTVALMDQAPPAITQTINRVVEHTVERVVPQSQPAAAAETVKETVIVKESDSIAGAVSDATPSVLRISSKDGTTPLAVGLALTENLIVTDSAIVKDGTSYTATLEDGSVIALDKKPYVSGSLALFSVDTEAASNTPALTPLPVQRTLPKLGETVIALTGLRAPRIDTGVVTSIVAASSATSTEGKLVTTPSSFESSIDLSPLAAGSVFISTSGALVGVYTSSADTVLPASVVSGLRTDASESSDTAH